jgi:hypothetical protein
VIFVGASVMLGARQVGCWGGQSALWQGAVAGGNLSGTDYRPPRALPSPCSSVTVAGWCAAAAPREHPSQRLPSPAPPRGRVGCTLSTR